MATSIQPPSIHVDLRCDSGVAEAADRMLDRLDSVIGEDHAVSATPSGQRPAVAHRFVQGWRVGTSSRLPAFRQATTVPAAADLRPRSSHLYALSLITVMYCVVLWIRAKSIGEDERGNAERRALFVGLWPVMFWLMGDTLRRSESRQSSSSARSLFRHR